MAAHPTARPERRAAGWLWGALFCLYVLIGGGHLYSPDAVVMFRVTESLLAGRTDIQPLESWPTFGGAPFTAEGAETPRFYAKYGLGQSLAAVPTLLLGRALAPWVPARERGVFDTPVGLRGIPGPDAPYGEGNPFRLRWYDWSAASWPLPLEAWTASWTNAWVVAATCALLFLLCGELGFGVRASLATALLAGLATPLAPYAKTFFSEPLAGLALTGFALLLVRAVRRERGTGLLAGAGAALGVAVLTKIALAPLLLPAGLLALGLVLRRETHVAAAASGTARARALGAFGLGLLAPLAVAAAYNAVRFGDPFQTGYAAETTRWTTPFLEGAAGLLLSPGKGLVWFAPIVLFAAVVAPRFARRFPMEAAFAGAALATVVGTHARWYMWEGGWCFGPRFLVPVLPLLLLPVGAWLAARPGGRTARIGFAAAVVASLAVVSTGLFVNPIDFHHWVQLQHQFRAADFAAAGATSYYDLVRWDWRFSPLVAGWSFPVKDAFLLPHVLRVPGLLAGVWGGFALGLCVCLWRLRAAVVAVGPEPGLSGSEAVAAP